MEDQEFRKRVRDDVQPATIKLFVDFLQGEIGRKHLELEGDGDIDLRKTQGKIAAYRRLIKLLT